MGETKLTGEQSSGGARKRKAMWVAFNEERPTFQAALGKAYEYLRQLALRPIDRSEITNRIVSELLLLLLDDIDSVMLLCYEDNLNGAHKLLRCVFERLVTAKYVSENEGEAERFAEFDVVSWFKYVTRLEQEQGSPLPDSHKTHILKAYEEAKASFRPERCPTCKRRGPDAWTEVTMPEMTQMTGFSGDYLFCYLAPTLLLHGTYWGVTQAFSNIANPKPETLSIILQTVHRFLIEAILLHHKRFDFSGKSIELTDLQEEFRTVWRDSADTVA